MGNAVISRRGGAGVSAEANYGRVWKKTNISGVPVNFALQSGGNWVCTTGGDGLFYSADGKIWVQSGTQTGEFAGLMVGKKIWVAGGLGTGIFYSANGGRTWISSQVKAGKFGAKSMIYADGTFFASNENGGETYNSLSGDDWYNSYATGADSCRQIAYGDGLYAVASGLQTSAPDDCGVYYSRWRTERWDKAANLGGPIECLCQAEGKWVTGSGLDSGIYWASSPDSWAKSDKQNGIFSAIYFLKNTWFAVVKSSTLQIFTSQNAANWRLSENINFLPTDMKYAAGMWVSGSEGDGIFYSEDGILWKQSNLAGKKINFLYNSDGVWLAGAEDGFYFSQLQ